jgi:hypothetical protein
MWYGQQAAAGNICVYAKQKPKTLGSYSSTLVSAAAAAAAAAASHAC